MQGQGFPFAEIGPGVAETLTTDSDIIGGIGNGGVGARYRLGPHAAQRHVVARAVT